MKGLAASEKVTKQKEKKAFYVLILLVIIYGFHRVFFEQFTLNQPGLIYLSAFSVSIFSVLIIKRTNFKNELEKTKSRYKKYGSILVIFLKYVIAYFAILVCTFLLAFSIINKIYSRQNSIEYFNEEIIQIDKGTRRIRAMVMFYFKDELNSVAITNDIFKTLKEQDRIWRISFSCRKGLLGSYILEDWNFE